MGVNVKRRIATARVRPRSHSLVVRDLPSGVQISALSREIANLGSSLGGSNPSLGAIISKGISQTLEPLARFELLTSSLPMRCYTPKPQWRISADLHDDYNGSSNISVVKTSFSTVDCPQRLII